MPVVVAMKSTGAVAPAQPDHFPEPIGEPGTTDRFTTNTTPGAAVTHDVNFPDDVMEDDLLLAYVSTDGSDKVTSWGGGFQQLAQHDDGLSVGAIAWKRADGGEGGGTFPVTLQGSEQIAAQVWKITNADVDNAPQVSSVVDVTSDTVTPPAITGLAPARYSFIHSFAHENDAASFIQESMTHLGLDARNSSHCAQHSDFLKPSDGSTGLPNPVTFSFSNTRHILAFTTAIAHNPNGGYAETEVAVVNPGAEVDVSGWIVTLGNLTRRTSSPDPFEGSGYFYGGASTAETIAYQDIPIPASLHSVVDAGRLRGRVEWHQNGFGPTDDDEAEIQIEWYDDGSPETQIGATVSAGLRTFDEWTERKVWAKAPSGARVMRIVQHMVRQDGSNADGYIDAIKAFFQDHTLVTGVGSP